MEEQIRLGKRPGNPLRKRVWRDVLRDWKRYLMIFAILVVTIAFVSGMYVANNSTLHSMTENITVMKRESGHFELDTEADEALLTGIASGERADVVAVFRERAYAEAEPEVETAVRDAVAGEVEKQVTDAIRQQVTQAVEAQFAQAAAMGMAVPAAEKQATLDEALSKAMREMYDDAYDEALEAAYASDDYKTALSDAMDEARKEIDKEIGETYDELAERYELNDDAPAVPVDVYPLFYREDAETLPGKDDYAGKIRVYSERRDIDLYDILDGHAPQSDTEILIDRMHADNAGICTGDTIRVGSVTFTVSGLAAFVDYSTLYEKNTDTMFDALTFNVAMVTDAGFDRIGTATHYNYAFLYKTTPADLIAEKAASDSFLKALITQTAAAENETEIEDYVPAFANQAINFAQDDMGSDKAMGGVLLYILTAVLAFIFAVTISTTLEQEASVIGTLRASGFTKGELLRYYMSAPLIVVLLAAVVGNVLGYTVFKNIIVAMYRNSYSLPGYVTLWTPDAFVRTTVVPIVLMLVINLFVIIRTLRLSPLRFLRHDLKQKKRSKAIRLPSVGFLSRFRMRVFLQNLPNYLMLFIGIVFVMLMTSMAVGLPATLAYYQDSLPKMMFCKEQVLLTSCEDEDGNTITTDAPGAERFSMTSLERKSDVYNEAITIFGIVENSRYITLDASYYDRTDDAVYISEAYAKKYNVKEGDTIVLSEKYENKSYTWTVCGIYPYTAGIAVFLPNERFNSIFEQDAGSFTGYLTNEHITDIPEDYIAKTITVDDMTKLAKQLDHSMGSYMAYFQVVCLIVAAIILYLLTKIIIEKNERSISMAKILGYSNGEITSLYLIPTAVVVLLSEGIAIYLGYLLMVFFWKIMMMSLGGYFAFIMTPGGFVKEFLLVFAAYLLITVLDVLRIRKIPKALALKNVE
ncbi:MAG: permease [Oscillospiraceae bacterium]|nr:permease [Oscillospiraceae bacterium]